MLLLERRREILFWCGEVVEGKYAHFVSWVFTPDIFLQVVPQLTRVRVVLHPFVGF